MWLMCKKREATVYGMHIRRKDRFSCTTCDLGKMTPYRNREADTKAKQPLHLVHCDVDGLMEQKEVTGTVFLWMTAQELLEFT